MYLFAKNKRIVYVYSILSCIYLFHNTRVYGQAKVLSLQDALQMAEKNYPLLNAKNLYTRSAESALMQSKWEYMPTMRLSQQLTYGTGNSLPGTYFTYGLGFSTSGGISTKNYNDAAFGAITLGYFEWAVYGFGQLNAKKNIAKSQLGFAWADEANERFQEMIRTAQTYLDLLAIQKLRSAQEQNLQRTQTIRKLIVAAASNGLRPGVDSSFANAEVSKARLELIDIQQKENQQKASLAGMLGSVSINFVLDTTVFIRFPQINGTNPNLAMHPLLAMYDSKISASAARESYIKRAYLPKISVLGATWGRGSGMSPNPAISDNSFGGGTALTRFDYAVGVAASFNIADYPRMRAEANAEKFKTMAIQAEKDEQSLWLKNQNILADENLALAYNKVKEAPVQLSSARDAYTQKLSMYNSGLSNLTELAQALYNLSKAESDMAVANDAVWKAWLFKVYASGDINTLLNQL